MADGDALGLSRGARSEQHVSRVGLEALRAGLRQQLLAYFSGKQLGGPERHYSKVSRNRVGRTALLRHNQRGVQARDDLPHAQLGGTRLHNDVEGARKQRAHHDGQRDRTLLEDDDHALVCRTPLGKGAPHSLAAIKQLSIRYRLVLVDNDASLRTTPGTCLKVLDDTLTQTHECFLPIKCLPRYDYRPLSRYSGRL